MTEHADWDGGRCPRCNAGTLAVTVEGVTYRYCSYVHCTWGMDGHDVIVEPEAKPAP